MPDSPTPRIRFQPYDTRNNCNPDWLWVEKRWKDEADYYGEELTQEQVENANDCPNCGVLRGSGCVGGTGKPIGDPHRGRRRIAGETELQKHGPRFTKR